MSLAKKKRTRRYASKMKKPAKPSNVMAHVCITSKGKICISWHGQELPSNVWVARSIQVPSCIKKKDLEKMLRTGYEMLREYNHRSAASSH